MSGVRFDPGLVKILETVAAISLAAQARALGTRSDWFNSSIADRMKPERTVVPEFEMLSCPTVKLDRCPRCRVLMLASRMASHTREQCDLNMVHGVIES